jgi:transitional endoplasmic reticulum ATPase
MARRGSRHSKHVQLSPTLELWILRILVPLGVHRSFVNQHDFSVDALAEALGLGDWIEPSGREFNPQAVRAELRKKYQDAERKRRVAGSSSLISNIARLQALVGLSETDCLVLEFAVSIHNDRLLDAAADGLGTLSTVKVFHVLSVVLDIPEREIRASLSPMGALARSGLVSVDRSGSNLLRGKLDLLSQKFADAISSSDADPVILLRDIVVAAGPAELELSDYGHVQPLLDVLRPYLKQALAVGRRGVNVYMHGDSGTGKSQLAKVLAQELGCELFEVASEDSDGDPVKGESRLRAFRAAQSFFAQRRALILFDEVEDVFHDADGFFLRKSIAQTRKAWINRMLEENLVPTLWLSNSIRGMDPAFIRRFDVVFELPVPPKRQRERILERSCADLVPVEARRRVAEAESLAPAVVTRAASVVRMIRDEVGDAKAASAFEHLIDTTLKAQGHGGLHQSEAVRLPGVYDPAFIHADADLAAVLAGLVASKSGRLCLYGPPGTGKTAFARWLAEQMGVVLVVKRASDLMSKWVGENEQNIAAAFAKAERDAGMLLIDEVDSFLQDRRGAQRGWEVSLVNEMLTQMESFGGVFIASTNLMEGLDPAALRRFDLKVKFDYLKPDQAAELLRRYCVDLGLALPQPGEIVRVSRLDTLTPGDFAAVVQQGRFRALTSAAALVGALEAECVFKPSAKRAIGFY